MGHHSSSLYDWGAVQWQGMMPMTTQNSLEEEGEEFGASRLSWFALLVLPFLQNFQATTKTTRKATHASPCCSRQMLR